MKSCEAGAASGCSEGGDHRASRTTVGRPSWRNSIDRSADQLAAIAQGQSPGLDEPAEIGGLDTLATGTVPAARAIVSSGTARTIRSWASEIQISV